MHIRSTKNGKIVVRFESNEYVPDEGFIQSVNHKRPTKAQQLDKAIIKIGGESVNATDVSIEKALVVVWQFKTIREREVGDKKKATLLGGASTYQDLRDLFSSGGCLAYTHPRTGKEVWVSYAEAGKLFGEGI